MKRDASIQKEALSILYLNIFIGKVHTYLNMPSIKSFRNAIMHFQLLPQVKMGYFDRMDAIGLYKRSQKEGQEFMYACSMQQLRQEIIKRY